MSQTPVPRAPTGLKTGGKHLWSSVVDRYELERHELVLLTEACRSVDALDALAKAVADDGAVIATEAGPKPHPALVESRQQKVALGRIIALLRLPEGDEGDHQAHARRPQRRGGFRGPQALR